MASIASIDAQIAKLEQEIVLLKIARNALTPLGRLPDELLVHLVKEVATDDDDSLTAHLIYHMTAIYSRLRAAVISCPELWIDINGGWQRPRIDCHLVRAGSCALTLTASLSSFGAPEYIMERILECIPRVGFLSVHHIETADIVRRLGTVEASMMDTLILEQSYYVHSLLDTSLFTPMVAANLRRVRLDGFVIDTVVRLPQLCYFSLAFVSITIVRLHGWLLHMRHVEEIHISDTHFDDVTESMAFNNTHRPKQLFLPRLFYVALSDNLWWMSRILPFYLTQANISW